MQFLGLTRAMTPSTMKIKVIMKANENTRCGLKEPLFESHQEEDAVDLEGRARGVVTMRYLTIGGGANDTSEGDRAWYIRRRSVSGSPSFTYSQTVTRYSQYCRSACMLKFIQVVNNDTTMHAVPYMHSRLQSLVVVSVLTLSQTQRTSHHWLKKTTCINKRRGERNA